MHKVGFVILTWNSQNCIKACLESIFAMDAEKLSRRIVVIDNGSTDNTVALLDAFANFTQGQKNFSCDVIRLKKNIGTTRSRNMGIKKLLDENYGIEYICILDSDTVVNTEAMLSLINVLDDRSVGIVGPKMHSKDMTYQRSGRQIPTLTEKLMKVIPIKGIQKKGQALEAVIQGNGCGSVEVGYLMSACWMMRKDIIDRVGYLDEKIFYAPEDVDYCIRSWLAGQKVMYCYDADILHEWQRLSRKKLFSKHNYEHIKGLIYMFAKHRYCFNAGKIYGKTK